MVGTIPWCAILCFLISFSIVWCMSGHHNILVIISTSVVITLGGRSLFLISFFIIWSMLLSNIITGHIIDAFMEIRDEKDKQEADTAAHCFICSLDRFTFEQV